MALDDATIDSILRAPPADRLTTLARLLPESVDPPIPSTASGGDPRSLAAVPRGDRRTALDALAAIDPVEYARTRNHVGGAVTGLSPWIRHGVLSLAEVRDAALARVGRPDDAEKLVAELAWRDYWRQVHAALGNRIFTDVESPAAAARSAVGPAAMPADVLTASTGMPCIDAFVQRLLLTGRLHNHERMWLASWLVHVRRVPWRTGADWFLRHLIDGDPASNHLSWQWVAGTFSAKPYVFNRENLQAYTNGSHCTPCRLLGHCDVEGSYDDLHARLFAAPVVARPPLRIPPPPAWRLAPGGSTSTRPLVWLTLDSIASTSPAAAAFPDAPRLFVFDPAWFAAERPSLKRLAFIFDCLADVPDAAVAWGDPRVIVPKRARAGGCNGVAVADTPCPRVRASAAAIAADLPVVVVEPTRFCDRSRVDDLGRFSRYWNRIRSTALRPTPPADLERPAVPDGRPQPRRSG